MNASELIATLEKLLRQYGDLPVTVAHRNYEYSLLLPDFTEAGRLPNVGDAQKQDPPARFVCELKDDINGSN